MAHYIRLCQGCRDGWAAGHEYLRISDMDIIEKLDETKGNEMEMSSFRDDRDKQNSFTWVKSDKVIAIKPWSASAYGQNMAILVLEGGVEIRTYETMQSAIDTVEGKINA